MRDHEVAALVVRHQVRALQRDPGCVVGLRRQRRRHRRPVQRLERLDDVAAVAHAQCGEGDVLELGVRHDRQPRAAGERRLVFLRDQLLPERGKVALENLGFGPPLVVRRGVLSFGNIRQRGEDAVERVPRRFERPCAQVAVREQSPPDEHVL